MARRCCGRRPELARESSRDSEKAVILFEGGDAALVRRAGYDRLFTKKDYDRNPYQIAPPLFSWAALRAEGFSEWAGRLIGKPFEGMRDKIGAGGEKKELPERAERKALPPPSYAKEASEGRPPEPAGQAGPEDRPQPARKGPLSRDEMRAEYLRVDAALKASNYSSMTPEEQKEFCKRFHPVFGAMLAVGRESMTDLQKMLETRGRGAGRARVAGQKAAALIWWPGRLLVRQVVKCHRPQRCGSLRPARAQPPPEA